MSTFIHFDNEHSVKVSEEPGAIEDLIASAGDPPVPLIQLTRTNSKADPVWINIRTIRTIAPGRSGKVRVVAG